jgi:hypothetical protein
MKSLSNFLKTGKFCENSQIVHQDFLDNQDTAFSGIGLGVSTQVPPTIKNLFIIFFKKNKKKK